MDMKEVSVQLKRIADALEMIAGKAEQSERAMTIPVVEPIPTDPFSTGEAHGEFVRSGYMPEFVNLDGSPSIGYIDLGLPSGTKWASQNMAGYYTFEEAKLKFGDDLPTKADFEELLQETMKEWDSLRIGAHIMGLGGSILLPARGYIEPNERFLRNCGASGAYWSATRGMDNDSGTYLFLSASNIRTLEGDKDKKFSVRLVKHRKNENS